MRDTNNDTSARLAVAVAAIAGRRDLDLAASARAGGPTPGIPMTETPIDATGGTNVLLLDGDDDRTSACCHVLQDVGPPAERAELSVWYPEDLTDRLSFDTGTTGRQPAKRGQITIGEVLRARDDGPPDFSAPLATDVVSDPGDLRSIGITISRFCEMWADGGYRIVLCFESVQELLDHAAEESVFRFLHALLERLHAVEAVAHVHADAVDLDGETLATFAALFDEVIDADEADALLDDGALAAEPIGDPLADDASDDGIPATSGSSRASDREIAERLDDRSPEPAGGRTPASQASDDEIADRIPDDLGR